VLSAKSAAPRFRTRARRAFTLAEVIAAVAVIAVLLAAVVPVVAGRLESSRADAIVGEMRGLEAGLRLFVRDVGRYPRRLDYLNVLADAGGIRDVCGIAIPAQLQARYRGPYINRPLEVTPANTRYSLATGDTVETLLTRTTITNPVTGGTQQVLQISVSGPEQSLIEAIDESVDGVIDRSNGIVRYAVPAANENTLLWTFPIQNGGC
jgi:prepilin-type N-terminal cleavage/methylation domain-containing protein